ncbi:hypothetical protein CJ030_MR2G007771 [Morella rubra]|uniref:Uncharacterized protein n=1 Tax=Morella rubra TaxID=262757 RepID=A0A6A1WIS6_9ROSI|nr:hypothetical protein CJ030_MR2G007771 [Morella rubra]
MSGAVDLISSLDEKLEKLSPINSEAVDLISSLDEKLEKLTPINPEACIFRVHSELRELFRMYANKNSRNDSDPIFQMSWMLPGLKRDLLLLENQLPFFVLTKLFEMTKVTEEDEVTSTQEREIIFSTEEHERSVKLLFLLRNVELFLLSNVKLFLLRKVKLFLWRMNFSRA